MRHFRQLFDSASATYTYLLADLEAGQAVLIDPVLDALDLYLGLLDELGAALTYTLETHVHADHITAAAALRSRTGARIGAGRGSGTCADLFLAEGYVLSFGNEQLHVIETPGHTEACVSYRWEDRLFTGDALLIGGCGRTDLPGGDAGRLYDNLMRKIFTLPDETLVYPAHDYRGRWVSCVGEERAANPRLSGRTRDEFIALMAGLHWPEPKMMETALPANRRCGDLLEVEAGRG